MANLTEVLEMLQNGVMEKVASKNEDSTTTTEPETPVGVEEITKSASARSEAEQLGAEVAAQLLKQAGLPPWLEKKEDEKSDDKKEDGKDEGKKEESDSKDEKSEDEDNKEDNKDKDMDKKASLASVIAGMLEKSALEGDANTQAGIPEGVVPNKAQVDSAAMVADQDAIIGVTPGTDGNSQGGTVNQILDAIVAKAQSQGTVNPDQTADGHTEASAERQDDDVEKSAAVSALVESGIDFDSAVDLVKQAEVELLAEAFEVEKKAAFDVLVAEGVDFDTAASLVSEASDEITKQAAMDDFGNELKPGAKSYAAGAATAAKRYGKSVKDSAPEAVSRLQNVAFGLRRANTAPGRAVLSRAVKGLAKNPAARLAAGITGVAGAAGTAAALRGREKRAAFDALIESGVDFDTAVDLVKEAEFQVYGE